jgi:uncharacterized peroxidase-related enzyme
MSRLHPVQPDQATGQAKELLDAVKAKLKMVPNMTRVMANSPAVLQGYLSFSGALAGGSLDPKLREEIALEVADQNSCQYCLSAHTAIGKMAGLSAEEIEMSRSANSSSAKTAAALKFAQQLVASRGQVSEADLEAVRQAGYNEGEIAEIIAHVALNIFTNYFNIAAGVEVDFPKIALRKSA